MGKYINKNSNGTGLGSSASDKINRLVEDGATTINTPVEWNENLVCVVDNGFSVLLVTHMMKRNESIFYHLMEDLMVGIYSCKRDC
jgi:hypothetical protein